MDIPPGLLACSKAAYRALESWQWLDITSEQGGGLCEEGEVRNGGMGKRSGREVWGGMGWGVSQ